jgi:hypothetical protein
MLERSLSRKAKSGHKQKTSLGGDAFVETFADLVFQLSSGFCNLPEVTPE